jgi:hypothetical protein
VRILTDAGTPRISRVARFLLGIGIAAGVVVWNPFVDRACAQVQVGNSRVRVVANRLLESLTFELHAVNDEVLLYAGGPRELMLLDVRPSGVPPRVDISPGLHPTLRVRDLSIYDVARDEEVYLDDEAYEQDAPEEPVPESQSWETILTALVPTDFYLDIEKGEGHFDFTDMFVRNLRISSHFARTVLEFSKQNVGELERLQLIAEEGEVDFRDVLNAHPKSVTIQTHESECDIRITGKPFAGAAEIYLTGTPRRMRFVVSRQIGVRIEGPAATVARFDAKHMERRGLALYSRGYDDQTCTVLLHFAENVKDLDVEWD